MKQHVEEPTINRDRRAVYVCDGCGDAMESGPGLCPRCQAPLTEDVAARWLALLMEPGEVIQ